MINIIICHISFFIGCYPYQSECVSLEDEIAILIESAPLANAHIGFAVFNMETGLPLMEYNAKKLFIPASVTKLFTTTAAIFHLGKDYRFKTSVLSQSPIDKGKIDGNLILKGGNDPTLSTDDLKELANNLYLSGLRKIQGKVIADVHFSELYRIPHAELEDCTWYYCPEISTLSLNDNAITVGIYPADSITQQAKCIVQEKIPYLTVYSGVRTVSEGDNNIIVNRSIDGNNVFITGTISINSEKIEKKIAVHNPIEYARQVFIKELKSLKIAVLENEQVNDSNKLIELAFTLSPPLEEIVKTINKQSHNLAAELILREIEIKEDKDVFKALKNESLLLYNGSGLSRHNLITPYDVCMLLLFLKSEDNGKVIFNSLPIAGVDGTLNQRFINTIGENNIRAKTGTLSGVTSLAGYAKTKAGKNICFCIFINSSLQNVSSIHDSIDQIALKIIHCN